TGTLAGDGEGKRVERETGIEPATNSLEGCDSTTELLPPSCSPPALGRLARLRWPPGSCPARISLVSPCAPVPVRARCHRHPVHTLTVADGTRSRAHPPAAGGPDRGLVARGGIEPPKPLGRQTYSLLRLTAPQPRRARAWSRAPPRPRADADPTTVPV